MALPTPTAATCLRPSTPWPPAVTAQRWAWGAGASSARLMRCTCSQGISWLRHPTACPKPPPLGARAQVREMYAMNHELASHTVTHTSLYANYANLATDILGGRDYVVGCGIPKEDVVGGWLARPPCPCSMTPVARKTCSHFFLTLAPPRRSPPLPQASAPPTWCTTPRCAARCPPTASCTTPVSMRSSLRPPRPPPPAAPTPTPWTTASPRWVQGRVALRCAVEQDRA